GKSGQAGQQSEGLGNVVKAEILHQLEITPEKHRQAFRAKKAEERKFPRVLWQCLADLLNKWLRPELLSKEQVYDQILLEQFINDLEEDTQRESLQLAEQFNTAQGSCRQVKTAKGTEAPVNKSIDFKMGRKKTPLNLACFTCRQKGHIARNRPRGSQFGLANEPGLADGRQGQGLPRELVRPFEAQSLLSAQFSLYFLSPHLLIAFSLFPS
uniref:SCAN box domain-containing protein n=1 Tax=Crocodylus porosus TaxID=8502 RepID=A0A7M4FGW5_CROPO